MKGIDRNLRSIFFTTMLTAAILSWDHSFTGLSATSGIFQQQSLLFSQTENTTIAVPREFQQLYTKLQNGLRRFEQKLDSEWDGSKYSVVFSAQLFTANSNAGENLLTHDNYHLTLTLLDNLQSLGVTGITLDINFPLLAKGFLEETKRRQYLNFYKNVCTEIKNRNLVIAIETQSIFPDFSPLPVKSYYNSLSYDEFRKGKLAMMQEIVRELKPDYMTVSNEPDTEAINSGQPVNTLRNYLSLVRFYLDGLNNSNVKYGSGFGTWQKDHATFLKELVKIPKLDFVNIHIYPIDRDFLDRVITMSDLAKQNGKKAVIHESWLHKWQIGSRASQMEIHARNSFRFWQPLDKNFLDILVKLAHYKQLEYVSPFWSAYFFAYVDHENVRGLPPQIIFRNSLQAAENNVRSGIFTSTGTHYGSLIE